jgi:3-oxoacyl-[acyl-carrier protein] reductase
MAVVSGGGTGMGKAIAARLIAEGDHVIIIGRRPEVLEKAAAELSSAGPGEVSWQAADLTRPQDVEQVPSMSWSITPEGSRLAVCQKPG